MDKAKTTIMEDLVPPPSRRSAFTITTHPDKDQLILFGGEYFNGSKVCIDEDFWTASCMFDSASKGLNYISHNLYIILCLCVCICVYIFD